METRDKTAGVNTQQKPNSPALSSASWLWSPFSYLWENYSAPIEAQQEAVRPAEGQKQSEETLVRQETVISSFNMSELSDTLESSMKPAAVNTPGGTSSVPDNTYVSFVFKPVPPSPAASPADPHPAQDTAEEDAAVARTIEISLSAPAIIPLAAMTSDTNCIMEKTNTADEEAASSQREINDPKTTEEAATKQDLIAQIAKLKSDKMQLEQQLEQLRQENLKKLEEDQRQLQKEKEDWEQLRKNLETQEASRQQEEKILRELKERQRAEEEKVRQEAMLLQREQEQQRAEAQAAEERRKAEEAFSRSCSTKARTLEEHYRLARAAVARAGF